MLAQLTHWFRLNPLIEPAHHLYIALVNQARQPFFYEKLQVPDSLDGRFDMIVLHVFLLCQRLKDEDDPYFSDIVQQVIDVFFTDMDRSLREMGVGDMGVGKRVKKMGTAFNGRLTNYENCIDDSDVFIAALKRNVYGTVEVEDAVVKQLADYTQVALSALSEQDAPSIVEAKIGWPAV